MITVEVTIQMEVVWTLFFHLVIVVNMIIDMTVRHCPSSYR